MAAAAATANGGRHEEKFLSRDFIPGCKRVIVKVGTAVVTQANGRLALGRLGALVEQLEQLVREGKEMILVTSGACGVGRQRLRYTNLLHSSVKARDPCDCCSGAVLTLAASPPGYHQLTSSLPLSPAACSAQDLHDGAGLLEIDGKAAAAAGQSGLMALYDMLFSQLDLVPAQILVTDEDFKVDDFRKQLRSTVDQLLRLKASACPTTFLPLYCSSCAHRSAFFFLPKTCVLGGGSG